MFLSRFINWLYTQSAFPRLFKATLVLGIFGFIPGAWLVGIPLLCLYGVYKRHVLLRGISNAIARTQDLWRDFSARAGEFISNQIVNNPLSIVKFFLSLFLFESMSIPCFLLGTYALYRFTNEELQESAVRCANGVINFFSVGVANTLSRVSFTKVAVLWGIASIAIAVMVKGSGASFFLELAKYALQYTLLYAGARALWSDGKVWIANALRNPIPHAEGHTSKVLGVLAGRWLSYELFTGKLVGTMGPSIGQVKTQGVFSALIPAFLSPQKGWFSLNSSYFSILLSKVGTLFNSVFSTFFFSHNMKVWGDFQGYIGPNAFQVFTMMTIGFFVGYGVQKFVDLLYQSVRDDAADVMGSVDPSVRRATGAIYDAKWHLAYTALVTPIILASPGAPQILVLAGGSLFGAAALTASTVLLTMGTIYGAVHVLSRVRERLMGQADVGPEAVHAGLGREVVDRIVLLPATTPSFTPGFARRHENSERLEPQERPLTHQVARP